MPFCYVPSAVLSSRNHQQHFCGMSGSHHPLQGSSVVMGMCTAANPWAAFGFLLLPKACVFMGTAALALLLSRAGKAGSYSSKGQNLNLPELSRDRFGRRIVCVLKHKVVIRPHYLGQCHQMDSCFCSGWCNFSRLPPYIFYLSVTDISHYYCQQWDCLLKMRKINKIKTKELLTLCCVKTVCFFVCLFYKKLFDQYIDISIK